MDQKAHVVITLNLDDAQLLYVVSAVNSYEPWDELASSTGQHISELEKLVLQMASGGFRPGEEVICSILLGSLL